MGWFWGPITFCGYLLYLPPASQARSATAIHKATSCPANRACAHGQRSAAVGVCWSDAHWISCSLQARAAAADLSSLVPVNTPECNQLNLPIKCSAGHASHAQPWHTLARSPGTHTGTHTGTLSRHTHWHAPPAHKYTGCCRVIPSFLHLPPPHPSRPLLQTGFQAQ